MTRDSMVFYSSFAEAIKLMPKEQQLEALWAIIDYGLDDTAPDQNANAMAKVIFQMAKPQIDANVKRKANGMMGGRPKNNGCEDEEPMVIESENHRLETEKPNVNVNDNVNDTKENALTSVKEKRFAPPTPENVNGYCREMGYTHVDAERFVNYYAAKGWKIGNDKIEDWKALVRNWERQDNDQRQGMAAKDPQTAQKKSANRFANFEQRQYDYDSMLFRERKEKAQE